MALTYLEASHLEPKEIIGRCISLDGGEGFDETETGSIEGVCVKWIRGGSWYSREPAVHTVLTRGMRSIEVSLLCRPNIRVPGARKFYEINGVPSFILEAERLEAKVDRLAWGTRLGGSAQLEVTVFAVELEATDSKLQLIARTLCVESKAYAKKLAPALFERRAEFFNTGDETKGIALARDWARAAARSDPFFTQHENFTVTAGVEWVRNQVSQKHTPETAAPKDKKKLTAPGAGRAYTFLDDTAKPIRMLFRSRAHGGTRLKIELKLVDSKRSSAGTLDISIDDLLRKNAEYPAGWINLTQGNGKIQMRLFNLDPETLPTSSTIHSTPLKTVETPSIATTEKTESTTPPPHLNLEPKSDDIKPKTKPPPPPAPKTKKNPPPPPPPPRAKPNPPPPRPALALDLASQLAAGGAKLKPASDRVLPPPPEDGGKFIFDELAANLAKLRTDVAADDDSDDNDFFDD